MGFATVSRSADVWVITDSQHPVKAPLGVRITLLDAASRIEAELATLPSDPQKATLIAKARLNAADAKLARRLAEAYQGVVYAWSLGVTKVPAVVVDKRYVVYGEPDLGRALRLIERHRSAER